MSYILFFDTETTDLPKFKLSTGDMTQPYVIQLAAILTNLRGHVVEEWSTLVQVGDVEMSPYAFKAHGITLEKANSEGISIKAAWKKFSSMVSDSSIIVGHNIPFDIRMMRIHCHRAIGDDWEVIQDTHCTMRLANPIVNLPPTPRMLEVGFTFPKNPTLTEAYRYFFDKELEGAHDALADVRACKEIFFEIASSIDF